MIACKDKRISCLSTENRFRYMYIKPYISVRAENLKADRCCKHYHTCRHRLEYVLPDYRYSVIISRHGADSRCYESLNLSSH